MRQWTGSALVQVIARRLFNAKPLPEPMQDYSQLDSWKQISVKFESKLSSAKMTAILSRGRWVKLIYYKMSFAHNTHFNQQVLLKFYTEHSNHTALICGKFQKDPSTKIKVMGEQIFARFQFKYIFWWFGFIVKGCWLCTISMRVGQRSTTLMANHIETLKNLAAMLQMIFLNLISWKKMFVFRLKFHWSLFDHQVQLAVSQRWFK